jgi:hypothetical protein
VVEDVTGQNAAAGRHRSPVDTLGSAGEEAVKLIEALSDWATSRAAVASEHVATGSPECLLCPVCQTIRALRQARPELIGHLGDAVGSLVAAVRSAIEAADRQRASDDTRPARVEHIDIR